MSISQTTNSNLIPLPTFVNGTQTGKTTGTVILGVKTIAAVQDTIVPISKSQAIKIVLDLEYLRILKQEDSILKIDTERFSYITKQKDSVISIMEQQNNTLSAVIINQISQQALLNDHIKRINKTTFWTKVERDAAVVALIFVSGYAVLKP